MVTHSKSSDPQGVGLQAFRIAFKTGLELEHELVNGLARALETFAATDARTGLGAVLEAKPWPNVTVTTPSHVIIHRGGEVARSTNDNIVARFLLTQGGRANLDEPVFLVWIDPIQPQVSAATATDVVQVGHTINGTVNEAQARNYYSGDGVTQLLILSAAGVQRFEVQLLGLGGSFRVGINYITRESTSTVTIQDSLYKDDVRLVYDFGSSTPTLTATATQVIPRTSSTSFASSDQATDSPSFLAQASASLMAAANAAARANANNPGNGDGSSGGESLSTDLANTADSEDATANNSANSNSTEQANAARDALNSLLAIFSSNETDITQMPGGAVIQQVVNFFRQLFGQPTPPASGTKTSPSSSPAKPGMSSNSPNGTNPSSNANPTTGSKVTVNNPELSRTVLRPLKFRDLSRSPRESSIIKVRSTNISDKS